ncbi:hypothetical protein RIF29_45471 [Crotalaria pallida]|uniref:Uncharacterized protein n=1 Tax=Crotalaria pallida TaxID=3830 RepID=A0AAN9DTI9_CROPI
MCSQASWLLVYLLSWKKGVATSRNSLLPGGMRKSDEPYLVLLPRLRAKRIRLKGKDDTIIIKGGRRFSLLLRKTIPLNEKHISSLYYFEYEKENRRQRDSLRIGMLTIDSLLGSYTEMKD